MGYQIDSIQACICGAGNAAAVPRAGSGEFTLAFDAPLPAVNWTAPGDFLHPLCLSAGMS